jgi:hypothetical protein
MLPILVRGPLGGPPYLVIAVLLAISIAALVSSIRQWRERQTSTRVAPSRRRLWVVALVLSGPLVLAAGEAVGYYSLLPARIAVWTSADATKGSQAWAEWASFGWTIGELFAALTATALAMYGTGWLAGAVAPVRAFDGYWLAHPVSALASYLLFASEPAFRTDLERWGTAMWLIRLVMVLPVYAWAFHAGGRRRRPGGAAERSDAPDRALS